MGVVYRWVSQFLLLFFGVASLSTYPVLAKAPRLSLPLLCTAQKPCFIQNYVDMDPSKGVRDYACHKSSYDGHKGVDFRIPSILAMKQGVPVVAAAPGIVRAVRDGMKDRLLRAAGLLLIKGRECGNGLVVDHGGGWETQYCHMRRGSLLVTSGQKVKRGAQLGLVGLSGKTTFPHIHLSVRHNGKIIDPFSGVSPQKAGCRATSRAGALWQKDILRQFPYISGQPFIFGFTERAVKKQVLMFKGGLPVPRSTKAPALVFFGQALNLQKGDRLGIRLSGPQGVMADTLSKPMNRHKASYLTFAGKRRINFAWPQGTYKGDFSLHRGARLVWRKSRMLELK